MSCQESFVIAHGTLCTLGSEELRVIEDGAVLVRGDEVAAVGTSADVLALPAAHGCRVVDARHRLILPGWVCAHSHFYGFFSRGMPLHDEPAANFLEILERLWWRLDRALDLEAVQLCAEAQAARGLRCGTTCYIDHHASPAAILGSLDALAVGTKRVGARAAFCYEVTDRNGLEGAREGIEENVRFMRRCAAERDPMLGATFGLHASFTVSDATLNASVEAVKALRTAGITRGAGFHVHAAEGMQDEEHCMREHGTRAILRLEKAGALGPDSVIGHGVHADAAELAALRRTHTPLVINPESNMNNAVGLPTPAALRELGDAPDAVGLGTDGMTYDMMQEFRAAALALRHSSGDALQGGAGDALRILTRANSLIASRLFLKPVGRLEPGCFADVILVDYDAPTPLSAGSLPWHLQFGGVCPADVRDVYVGGRLVVSSGRLVSTDEGEIYERCRKAAPRVWEEFRKIAEKEKAERKH